MSNTSITSTEDRIVTCSAVADEPGLFQIDILKKDMKAGRWIQNAGHKFRLTKEEIKLIYVKSVKV